MISVQHYESPLGGILLAADEIGLTGLWFDGEKYFADNLPAEYKEQETRRISETKRWLDIYFDGREPGLYAAAASYRLAFPSVCLGYSFANSIRADHNLRTDRKTDG